MKQVFRNAFLLIAVLSLPLWGHAQAVEASPASVEAQVDKTEITIGDQVNYTLEINYQSGVEVQKPEWGAGLEGFQILDFTRGEPTKTDSGMKIVDTYKLSTFTPEDYVIPPMKTIFKLVDGSTQELTTQPISIKVKSILPEDEKEYTIKDLKPPVSVFSGILTGRIITAIASALIMALLFWLIWRRSRRGDALPAYVKPPLPEHEAALQRLNRLEQDLASWGETPAQEQCHFYGLELSELLREYLGRRCEANALEMTTDEIRHWLGGLNPQVNPASGMTPSAVKAMLLHLLEQTDLYKFAKYVTASSAMREEIEQTRCLIAATMRQVAEVKADDDEDEEENPMPAPPTAKEAAKA